MYDYKDKYLEKYYNKLIDEGIVGEETLSCLISINGYNVETLNDILYWATGYKTLEQYEDKE